MKFHGLPAAMFLICAAPAAAQTSDAAGARLMDKLEAGRGNGNVPDELDFSRLRQDLGAYFAGTGLRIWKIRHERLRPGDEQSDLEDLQLDLWVEVFSRLGLEIAGAARVAIEKKHWFKVTDFLSATEINEQPDRIAAIFPAPLVRRILRRAASTRLNGATAR